MLKLVLKNKNRLNNTKNLNIEFIEMTKPALLICLIFLIIPFFGVKSTYIFNANADESTHNLNALFEQLRNMPDAINAQAAEQRLYAEIVKSGSPSIDALMIEASNQSEKDNLNAAYDTLETVITIKPDYSEGYNQLANIEYSLDLKQDAMKHLKQALKIEPRHFAAWAGLGSLYEEQGDYKKALSAYKNAAYYNPNFDEATRGIFRIESKINGLGM